MRLTNTKRSMIQGGVLLAAVAGGFFAACKSEGPPRPTCLEARDAGASDATADITPYTAITTDAQPIEAYGMEPDPGPQCLDCTQGRDLDMMTVVDFEDGFAPSWFNYGEPGVLLDPPAAGEGLFADGGANTLNPPPPYWGLQVAPLVAGPGGERCGSKYALHMEGGRFTAWGGGFVTRLFVVRGDYIDQYCTEGESEGHAATQAARGPRNGIGNAPRYMPGEMVDRANATGCFFYASPAADQPSLLGVDLAAFEGVSFWARRGPSGQSTLRIALVDDSVSEDLAFNLEREAYPEVEPEQAGALCTRVKGCCRHCTENVTHDEFVPPYTDGEGIATPAYVDEDVTYARCWLPGNRKPHFAEEDGVILAWDYRDQACGDEPTTTETSDPCWKSDTAQNIYNAWKDEFELCCPPTMEQEAEKPSSFAGQGDPRFGGKACLPYVFHYDESSGYYCAEPGDVLPEKNQNRCGESFETSIVLDTEWKLYTIPWTELRRFTPDKPQFNPGSVWQIALYFSQGYLDTYVDDIGFYRKRP